MDDEMNSATPQEAGMDEAGGMGAKKGKKAVKPEPVEFATPAGFRAPEPSDSGKEGEFDLVCTFKPCDDGKAMRLVRLGDFELPDEAPKEKQREKAPDYSEMAQGIVGAFQS